MATPAELEKILRPVDSPMVPFPAKVITLKSGKLMTVRQITRDEIPALLPHVEHGTVTLIGATVGQAVTCVYISAETVTP